MPSRKNLIATLAVAVIAAIIVVSVLIIGPFGMMTKSSSNSTTTTGSLAILLTDPPTVPSGVTAVYMTYTNLQVHSSTSGWVNLSPSGGQVDLLPLINSTKTVAVSSVPTGNFDEVRFSVSSILVTLSGANYSSSLLGNASSVTTAIEGGEQVSSGQTSVALINLNTIILPLNNSSQKFEFIPQVNCVTVPPSVLPSSALTTNAEIQVSSGTLAQIQQGGQVQILSANLAPNMLNVTIKNTGSSPFALQTLELTTLSRLAQSGTSGAIPNTPFMAIFQINSNSSTLSLIGSSNQQTNGGYTLLAGSSVTLVYSGEITLSPFSVPGSISLPLALSIASGSQYYLVVPGSAGDFAVTAQ